MYMSLLLQEVENASADWLRIGPRRKVRWRADALIPEAKQQVRVATPVRSCVALPLLLM